MKQKLKKRICQSKRQAVYFKNTERKDLQELLVSAFRALQLKGVGRR